MPVFTRSETGDAPNKASQGHLNGPHPDDGLQGSAGKPSLPRPIGKAQPGPTSSASKGQPARARPVRQAKTARPCQAASSCQDPAEQLTLARTSLLGEGRPRHAASPASQGKPARLSQTGPANQAMGPAWQPQQGPANQGQPTRSAKGPPARPNLVGPASIHKTAKASPSPDGLSGSVGKPSLPRPVRQAQLGPTSPASKG